jgi:hypothetical protein
MPAPLRREWSSGGRRNTTRRRKMKPIHWKEGETDHRRCKHIPQKKRKMIYH